MNLVKWVFMRKLITKGEAADLLHMTKSQIRFYEKKGLLTPEIDDNGYALYDFVQIDALEMILELKELDTPIKEIKSILTDETHYDYEMIMEKSYQSVIESLEKLNKKKASLEKRIALYHISEVDKFYIDHYDTRVLYQFEEDVKEEFTMKRVYDITMKYESDFLDKNLELCNVQKTGVDRLGVIKITENSALKKAEQYSIRAGNYFSYTFSHYYEDDMTEFKDKLLEEATLRGLTLDEEMIYIDHFGRKFYEKFKAVATIQKRIIET
jgi:DNA-binding transcriptional MerR regulator